MTKIALIHGYGAGLRINHKGEEDLDFGAFNDLIKKEDAQIFKWFTVKKISLFNLINIPLHLATYFSERVLASDKKTITELKIFLNQIKPTIIVCHSLGSFLLINFLKENQLPKSVGKIVLVQADLNRNFEIDTPEIKIQNFYCFWDLTLYVSIFLNHYLPAGLFGAKSKKIENKFFPLYNQINLHLSTISDKKFLEEVVKI